MNSQAIDFESSGTLNLGVAGNLHVTVNTGTQNFDVNTVGGAMTLQSTGLASAKLNRC